MPDAGPNTTDFEDETQDALVPDPEEDDGDDVYPDDDELGDE